MPGLNTKRERESVRKRGSVCELEVRERGIDRERGETEQCQVRNDKPVSMEQLFVIPKNTYRIWRKVKFTCMHRESSVNPTEHCTLYVCVSIYQRI